MYKALLICLSFSVLLISCKKDDSDADGNSACPTTNEFITIEHPDLLNCLYLTGTYWLYIDSVSNTTDSVFIYYDESGQVTDPCSNVYQLHAFNTRSATSLDSVRYAVVAGGLIKDYMGAAGTGRAIYSGFDPQPQLPQVTSFDSLFVYDQYYYNVMKYELESDPVGDPTKKSIYYTNADYGMLRVEKYENNVLTTQQFLTDKNIVR